MPYELKKSRTLLLPGDEPRTAITFIPLTEEAWAMLEASIGRHNSAIRQTGRDPQDGDSIRKVSALEREALAGAIVEIAHAHTEDVTLTEKPAIAAYLAELPSMVYRHIKSEILALSTLSDIEGKV